MFESSFDMIPSNDNLKFVLYEALTLHPLTDQVLGSSELLVQWVYKLHAYTHRQFYNNTFIDYATFKSQLDPDSTSISTWSHPTWKMIHYYPTKYNRSTDYALSYKAFISCLQFLLPCPKCRDHLKNNLADHPIDDYFGSINDLFMWSYGLHQVVNSQLGKKGITASTARYLYGLT
jgi:hypothetical protein